MKVSHSSRINGASGATLVIIGTFCLQPEHSKPVYPRDLTVCSPFTSHFTGISRWFKSFFCQDTSVPLRTRNRNWLKWVRTLFPFSLSCFSLCSGKSLHRILVGTVNAFRFKMLINRHAKHLIEQTWAWYHHLLITKPLLEVFYNIYRF